MKSSQTNLRKYVDATYSATPTTLQSLLTLTLPVPGNTETTMSGNSIDLDQLEVRYSFQDPSNTTAQDTYIVRMTIVQAIGSTFPTYSTVFQYVTGGLIITSPFVYDFEGQSFKVLSDKCYTVDSYNPGRVDHFRVRPAIRRCKYNTASAEYTTGQTYLFLTVNRFTSPPTDLAVNFVVRQWFYDV